MEEQLVREITTRQDSEGRYLGMAWQNHEPVLYRDFEPNSDFIMVGDTCELTDHIEGLTFSVSALILKSLTMTNQTRPDTTANPHPHIWATEAYTRYHAYVRLSAIQINHQEEMSLQEFLTRRL